VERQNELLREPQEKAEQLKKIHIGGLEAGFVLFWAILADALEFLGFMLAATLIGSIVWFLALIMGSLVSACIFLWAFLRGGQGPGMIKYAIKKVLIMMGGQVAEYATGGALPVRTISLVIAIWFNNHVAREELRFLNQLLKDVSRGKLREAQKTAAEFARARAEEKIQDAYRGGYGYAQPGSSRAVSARIDSTPYIYRDDDGDYPRQVGSASLNFASAKRREAEALLTPEAAKDPTERLMKELFYSAESENQEGVA